MKATDIKYIVIHCTAGYGTVEAIKKYWKDILKWRTGGYCRIVKEDGTIETLYPFSRQTNGVKGFNHEAIHIYLERAAKERMPGKEEGQVISSIHQVFSLTILIFYITVCFFIHVC